MKHWRQNKSVPISSVNLTWTEEEKKLLLQALETYGYGDLDRLALEIPTKTRGEIKYALGLYQKRGRELLKKDTKKGEERKAPIDKWMQYLKPRTPESRFLDKDVPIALKLLALYEKRVATEDIVLKDCYEYLYEISLGRPPKKINPDSMSFLMKTLKDCALDMKKEDLSKPMEFIKNLKATDFEERADTRKKGSTAKKPTTKVLKIPPELLQLNEQE